MIVRKLKHFSGIRQLGPYVFFFDRLTPNETFSFQRDAIVIAHNEYPQVYRIEIRFFDVSFIVCSINFMDAVLRLATEKEIAQVISIDHNYLNDGTIFCFESDADKFFIIASRVEATLHSIQPAEKELEYVLEPLDGEKEE